MTRNKSLVFSLFVAVLLMMVSIAPSIAQTETLIVWAHTDFVTVMTEVADVFEAETGVAVDVQEVSVFQVKDDLLNFGPVGEGPDVLIIENSNLGQMVVNGALAPIDLTGMEDLFLPAALDIFTYQNQLWGVPIALDNLALVRNTDLVPEAPKTWQEVQAISQEIQESGAANYGFLLQSGDPYHSYPIITAFGGYIFGTTDEGTWDVSDIGLNSEGGLAAAQWMADMYGSGLMVPDVNDDVIFELFGEGQVAMFMTGPWWSQRIIDAGVPYSIDPIPGAEGGLESGQPFSGGLAFAISAFSQKQLLAESFILDYVATDETMEALIFSNEDSVLTRSPAYISLDTSQDPNIDGFISAGQSAIPMPQIPEMGSVWSSWINANTLISQGSDPVESYNEAADQIGAAIERAQSAAQSAFVAGDLQDEVGCEADWDEDCEATQMEDQGDGIFTLTLTDFEPAASHAILMAVVRRVSRRL